MKKPSLERDNADSLAVVVVLVVVAVVVAVVHQVVFSFSSNQTGLFVRS